MAALALTLLAGQAMAESGPLVFVGAGGELDFAPGDMLGATGTAVGPEVDLTIALTPAAAERLASFTAVHVGQEVRILSCESEILRVTVIEPITSGKVVIGAMDEDAARALGAVLLGQAPCPDGG